MSTGSGDRGWQTKKLIIANLINRSIIPYGFYGVGIVSFFLGPVVYNIRHSQRLKKVVISYLGNATRISACGSSGLQL